MKATNVNKSRWVGGFKMSDAVCHMAPTKLLCNSDVSDQVALLADHAKAGGMQSHYEVRYAIAEPDKVKVRGGVQLVFVFPPIAPKEHVRVYRYLANARRAVTIISQKHNCIPIVARVWFDCGLLAGQSAFEAVIG